nr:ribonuclease H-like domain-containing protein [Tanacetum cinerariifolium]
MWFPTSVITKSKLVLINAARPVTSAVPKPHVTRPRPAKPIVNKPHLPPKRHINRSSSPKASNFPPKVTVVKVPHVNAAKGVQGKLEWKPKCPIFDHRNPQHALKDKGVIDSGCSMYMTGNMSYLSDFEELNGGYVAFGGNPKGCKISGKGKIRTGNLDFDDVYFVKELKFNIFSISQMCDKKDSVLFTDTKCLVLSLEFKLPNENQVLLRVPKENNMYNVNLENIVPYGDLTCLFAKATLYESNLWHIRLGHINFKTMNKLVKGIENQLSLKVKIIRSDNRTEFKNNNLDQFCGIKGIKREFSVPRTPQQKGIAERRNRTLIEAARTMLADSLLPISFWAEAVNTTYSLGKFNEKVDEGFLVGYSVSSKAFREPEFEGRKPESEVHVSSSSSAQSKKHDDKTKREAKGKKLEDITYSDDEEDIGAEADFNNLETSITKRDIGTKWFFRNKKDERGLIVRNKARLVAQGHSQEEGIDYKEVFAPNARIEAIRLFLAYASFMGFMVYQMDVKSAFLYGTIEEEVYVCQPPGIENPDYPNKVQGTIWITSSS